MAGNLETKGCSQAYTDGTTFPTFRQKQSTILALQTLWEGQSEWGGGGVGRAGLAGHLGMDVPYDPDGALRTVWHKGGPATQGSSAPVPDRAVRAEPLSVYLLHT